MARGGGGGAGVSCSIENNPEKSSPPSPQTLAALDEVAKVLLTGTGEFFIDELVLKSDLVTGCFPLTSLSPDIVFSNKSSIDGPTK